MWFEKGKRAYGIAVILSAIVILCDAYFVVKSGIDTSNAISSLPTLGGYFLISFIYMALIYIGIPITIILMSLSFISGRATTNKISYISIIVLDSFAVIALLTLLFALLFRENATIGLATLIGQLVVGLFEVPVMVAFIFFIVGFIKGRKNK